MNNQAIINLQDQGEAKNLNAANEAIAAARKATPEKVRDLFTSRIRYAGAGKYEWFWMLRD